MWEVRTVQSERSLSHILWTFSPFEWGTQKLSGTALPLSNDKCSVSCSYIADTHTNTHAHPFSVTLTDKHAHTLTLCLISPVSLQWAHCSATLLSPPPRLATLRIIEYRSLAFAAVCKRVCLWTSVCVCVWLGPSKVIAMATWAWGPLAVLSRSIGHRGHMKKGGQEGVHRGDKRGLVSAAVFGVLEIETETRRHESWNCPIPPCIHTRPE